MAAAPAGLPADRVGIVPGVKVDIGAKPLAVPWEIVTERLDGFSDRLQEYQGMGARFAKWRAVIRVRGSTRPGNQDL